MIKTDQSDRPQLVHKQQIAESQNLSRVHGFSVRLGFRQERKSPIDQAVEEAYSFLSQNYQSGDQVVLLVDKFTYIEDHRRINVAGMLAWHLYEGTPPGAHPKIQSKGGDTSSKRIPIHCIAVGSWGITESVSALIDKLKSKFPPGIERIVSWAPSCYSSCTVLYDSDDGVISREICFYDSLVDVLDWYIYSTEHVIYYEPTATSGWDGQNPVWTRKFSSPPGGAPLPAEVPVGMCRHELRKYEPLAGAGQFRVNPTRLVWKAFPR